MSSIILANQGKRTMRGVFVDTSSRVQKLELGDYSIEARLGRGATIAGGIIIQTGTNEFIVAGRALDIFFTPKNTSMRIGVDKTEEGIFENGRLEDSAGQEKWILKRRINGDEVHASTSDGTGPRLPGNKVSIQRISLYSYK